MNAQDSEPPSVRVGGGIVVGQLRDGIRSFLGIPYAAPPVGALRWRAPQAAAAWTAPLQATRYGPACPQPQDQLFGMTPPEQDEACLTLNVWAPSHADGSPPLPVMVWLHGGANRIGASSLPIYDGQRLAARGVIVVSFNYRLGWFGFFSHPALDAENQGGNFALMDQIAALKWVRDNIAAFGGDPAAVTAFGESAGATDLLYLMTSPAAAGLFKAAIVESAIGWDKPLTRSALQQKVTSQLNGAGVPARVDAAALRALPASKLVAAQGDLHQRIGPFIDQVVTSQAPVDVFVAGRQAAVPLIIGSNSWEASLIRNVPADPGAITLARLPKVAGWYGRQAADVDARRMLLFRDIAFAAPARWIAGLHARRAPSYLYRFDYVTSGLRGQVPGAAHAAELSYVFDTLDALPVFAARTNDEDRRVARTLADCWTGFAKTGAPGNKLTNWNRYDTASDRLLLIDAQLRETRTPDAATLDDITQMFGPGGMLSRR